jgi:phosphohistidine swiveling domain-containing protein
LEAEVYVVPLETALDVTQVGGKAAHLREVMRLGFRTPATHVIVRAALTQVIEHNSLSAEIEAWHAVFDTGSNADVEQRFAELSDRFRRCDIPPQLRAELVDVLTSVLVNAPSGLAIRSSSIHEDSDAASFAGVFESHIGVTDPNAALQAVIEVWLSGWAPRAMRYQRRMGARWTPDAMAVLIQPVIPATAAGVITTANPPSGNPWEFTIHTARGLSVDLMSGSGTGDQHILAWDDGAALSSDLAGKQPVLSAAELREVAALGLALDNAFGRRMDIEWAQTDGLWVLQARPLTAVPPFFPVISSAPAPEHEWEIAPYTIPLRNDVPQGLVTPLYADLSFSKLWYRYQPKDIILTGVWRHEFDINGYRFVETGTRPSFFDYLQHAPAREAWLLANEGHYRTRWDSRHVELATLIDDARRGISAGGSLQDLAGALLRAREQLWDMSSFGWSGPQALGWLGESVLRDLLAEIDPALRTHDLIGGEESHTFAYTAALQDLAHSIAEQPVRHCFERESLEDIALALRTTLKDSDFAHGYEALCWRFGKTPPSWRDRPPFWSAHHDGGDAGTMHTIRSVLRGEARDVRHQQQSAKQERDTAEARVRTTLAHRGSILADRFDRILDCTRYWTQALNDRHGLNSGLLWEREVIWHLGTRLRDSGVLQRVQDVLLIRAGDLATFARTGDISALKRAYDSSAAEYHCYRRLTAPAMLGAGSAHVTVTTPAATAGVSTEHHLPGTLQGVGFGRGHVRGRAVAVRTLDAAIFDVLTGDDILVLLDENAFAYADWHSLLMLVKGVISPARPAHHLTQVAREVGVPVVGHIRGDLAAIGHHAILDVDARSGLVQIVR